jgi:hypothetical protein
MYEVISMVGVALVVRKLIASHKPILLKLSKGESAREESLCRNCVCSLIRKNGKGEELTSCTYGGRLNPVNFTVLECSGYGSRNVESHAKVAGYVQPDRNDRGNVTVIRIACKTDTTKPGR